MQAGMQIALVVVLLCSATATLDHMSGMHPPRRAGLTPCKPVLCCDRDCCRRGTRLSNRFCFGQSPTVAATPLHRSRSNRRHIHCQSWMIGKDGGTELLSAAYSPTIGWHDYNLIDELDGLGSNTRISLQYTMPHGLDGCL
nr:hypothetical protein CFP56_13165 [Quercus suber]